jgi:hypothetical protein
MTSPIKTRIIETYGNVPILEVRYETATLLTPEVDLELVEKLLELPYPAFAVLLDHNNLSHASHYGPKEEAETRRSPAYSKLKERLISLVRFQAGSFTSMIQTMRASTLLRDRLQSHFAPDFDAALRLARRAIDQSQKERLAAKVTRGT